MMYLVSSILGKRILQTAKYKILHTNSGFTLPELLVTALVSTIAGVLLIAIFVNNNGLFYNQQAKVSQGLGLNNAISEMTTDVRYTSSIASSYGTNPVYTSSASVLVIKVPSIDGSGNIIENVYDHIVFTKDPENPKLLKKYLFPDALSSRPGENKVLSNDIQSLTFTYLDSSQNPITPTQASNIGITLVGSTQIGLSSQESSTSALINLRNN